MMRKILILIAVLAVPVVITVGVVEPSNRRTAISMVNAAKDFLDSLTLEQRSKCTYAFEDEQRFDWHVIPRPRKGIPLKELDAKQRQLAHNFLKTGLSQRGYLRATTIIELENVLRELQKERTDRDPELYYFTIFGKPSLKESWGWRIEGHHLSLNFTVVSGKMVATTPSFFGANPAEVRQGARQGLRVLGAEEDIARELLLSLDERQRAVAIFSKTPPAILTLATKTAEPPAPAGIQANQLYTQQMNLLTRLLEQYAASMPADLAAERMKNLRHVGLEKITFGWAGSIERGQGHYYRVQGPTFLIEYDNTQNNANHIHTVWRDFNGDFGRDLLREHYQNTPHKH
jgi:hypothetical protein